MGKGPDSYGNADRVKKDSDIREMRKGKRGGTERLLVQRRSG